MLQSSTIRIDQEVRAELQRRGRPLEDTPNSVLRRLLGLPEISKRDTLKNSRVARLIELAGDSIGQAVHWQPIERGYAILDRTESIVAYIRSQKERLKLVARKTGAENAGLSDWQDQRQDQYFGSSSVKWCIPDDDDLAYQRIAAVLGRLSANDA